MICTATAATVTVVGGKTVRCICRRARWYCTADDTFLCQTCDSSVHSGNPPARHHDRVRSQTNSISKHDKLAPTWWRDGFKRKARTRRPTKARIGGTVTSLVPEIETSPEEEQLSYRVPILDPVVADFCDSNSAVKPKLQSTDNTDTSNSSTVTSGSEFLASFLQSDAELAEFTVDVESLLGCALDNDSFVEELGLMGNCKYDAGSKDQEREPVKEELDNAEEDVKPYEEIDPSRQTLETNFDCRSADEGQEEATETAAEAAEDAEGRKKIGLRLNYEAIEVEWSVSGSLSPWMNGEQPRFGPDDCWLDHMGTGGGAEAQGLVLQGEMGTTSHRGEGREARVSRYREKRRTRLFSKRIRYEVRKLNAEKRPRMKGRFVKRLAFTAAASGAAARALSTD